MKFVGIDLHKKSISLCVRDASGRIVTRKRFSTGDTEKIVAFFKSLAVFRFCVEATSAYEWLVQLLEPMAQGWVLVHPGRMRLIAESNHDDVPLGGAISNRWLGVSEPEEESRKGTVGSSGRSTNVADGMRVDS